MISLVFLWSNLIDKEEIGRGSFGCVFTAKQSDGESAVVKKLQFLFLGNLPRGKIRPRVVYVLSV